MMASRGSEDDPRDGDRRLLALVVYIFEALRRGESEGGVVTCIGFGDVESSFFRRDL